LKSYQRCGKIDDYVKGVIADLIETMEASGHSVGIAAPQIGELIRVIVVDPSKIPNVRSIMD